MPAAVFAQLKTRQTAYPIAWGAQDADASWLQPARLLLFLQLNCSTGRSGACDDKIPAALSVNGEPVHGLKAYESRCTECTNVNHPFDPRPSARFNGWYWDVSTLFQPDVQAQVELALPKAKVPNMIGLFFENVETVLTQTFSL